MDSQAVATVRATLTAVPIASVMLVVLGCAQPSDQEKFLEAETRARSGVTRVFDVRPFPNITDEEARRLAGIETLEQINLDNSPVTDAVVAELARGIPGLRSLSLTNTRVTNAGLEPLTELQNLTFLRLDKTQVSDAGLRHLQGKRSLRYLSVWGTGVTDAGVERLRAASPHLQINR